MGQRDYFSLGTSNAICQVCGFKRKRWEMKLRWDGVWCCNEDWEIRQPQDFVRGLPEETAPEWTAPEVPDVFAEFSNLAGGGGYLGGTPELDGNGQTVGVLYGNLVQSVSSITVSTGPIAFTLSDNNRTVTFASIPPSGAIISWSGVWIDNAVQPITITSFPFALGDGLNTVFAIYGVS